MGDEKQVLFILANHDFRDEEYIDTERVTSESGIDSKVAALSPGDCHGVNGTVISTDYTFSNVDIEDYSAIVLIGGLGVEDYLLDESLHQLVNSFREGDKIVAAICWAPVVLANAGILRDKRATVWDGAKSDIENKGAEYTGESVTIDGSVITANGPDAAEAFGQAIADKILS